jgi:hypothetical protein
MPAASSVTSLGIALLLTAVLSTLLARLVISVVRLDTSLVTALRRTLPVLARFLRRLILAAFLLLPLLLSLPWLKQILELAVWCMPLVAYVPAAAQSVGLGWPTILLFNSCSF